MPSEKRVLHLVRIYAFATKEAAERFRESQELLAASIRRVSGELDEVGSALERYAAVL